jgi:hypothetical protein
MPFTIDCLTVGHAFSSKAEHRCRRLFGLIERFSEDIDVTVFRDDLGQAASVEELEVLSNKKRRAKLDAIRDACRAYITGPLRDSLAILVADVTSG